MRDHRTKSRLRDLVLYLLIGLGVAAFALIYASHAAKAGGTGELPLRWLGLAGETAVVFGYLLRTMRPYWGVGRFWAGFSGFLCVHLAACAALLLRMDHFGLLWFVFIGYGEWVVLAYLMDFLLRGISNPRSRHRKTF